MKVRGGAGGGGGEDAVPLPIVYHVLAFFNLLFLTSCVSFLVS